MHDPLAPLTRPGPGPVAPLLPADEVRRRGDRLRRRRRAGSAFAAAAAVASVAVTAAVLTGSPGQTTAPAPVDTPSSTAEPSPSPTEPAGERPSPAPGFLGAIPPDFPLTLWFPEPGGDNDVLREHDASGWTFAPCPWPQSSATDDVRLDEKMVSIAEPARIWGRQLVLFPDDATAASAVSELAQALERCPTRGGRSSRLEFSQVDPPLRVGDESFAVVERHFMDDLITTGATLHGVVRVGNAVLLTTLHGEFGAAIPEHLERIVAEELEPTVRLADEMCVFAKDDAGRRSPCDS